MTERYSYTGARLAKDVQDSFGDTGGVQLTNEMLLRWINDGQREVAQDSDFARSQSTTGLIAGTGTLDLGSLFSSQNVKQIEAITISGTRLALVPFSEYLDAIDGATAATSTGTPRFGTLRANALTMFPVPDKTVANAIVVYFTQWPADLTNLSAGLGIPDRFYVALRDWVLAQAYQLNDDLEGSQIKMGQFAGALQGQYERENIAPTETYLVVPDDDGWD